MDTIVPSDIPLGKHYTYTLSYPESMGGRVFYVGKGQHNRINDHEYEARSNKTRNPHKVGIIHKIWANGEQVVKTILAYFETHEEALQHEIALIFFMNGLTNMTTGGEGVIGMKRTEKFRQKMREISKGRFISEETRQKIKIARAKQVLTEEHKLKLSEAFKGRKHSEESIHKMSETKKGHSVSEEARKKIGKANIGRSMEHLYTKEVRRKNSEARRGRHQSEEHRRKNREGHLGQTPWNKGIPQSEEAKRKASKALTGRHVTFSEEHKHNLKTSPKAIEQRRKLNEAQIGRKRPPETGRKISEALKGHPGRPLSEEHKRKLLEANKNRIYSPHSEETRRKISESRKKSAAEKRARTAQTLHKEDWHQGHLWS